MAAEFDVVAIGDINLDWVSQSHLPFAFSSLTENGIITWRPIQEVPGGSGLNFAEYARREGHRPLLIGRVGQDASGDSVLRWLAERHMATGVSVDAEAPTGKAMIVRDATDIRLLVNNASNANARLDVGDVDRHAAHIGACAVLFVSGYAVKDPSSPSCAAAVRAMEVARSATATASRKPSVVFDVVPHRIYDQYSWDDFRTLTRYVDVLISEVATVRRFLGLGDRHEAVDASSARETAALLSKHYSRFILRFGPSGCDTELTWGGSPDALRISETGHATAVEKRGFGDLLAIRSITNDFRLFDRSGP